MNGNFVFPRNAFLGFDHIFDALQDIHTHANDGYPPHNVVREEDNKYVIEMAVAGFKKKDIEIKCLSRSLLLPYPQRPVDDLRLPKQISCEETVNNLSTSPREVTLTTALF